MTIEGYEVWERPDSVLYLLCAHGYLQLYLFRTSARHFSSDELSNQVIECLSFAGRVGERDEWTTAAFGGEDWADFVPDYKRGKVLFSTSTGSYSVDGVFSSNFTKV